MTGPVIPQTHPKNCMSFTSSLPPFGPTGQPFITTERLITGQVKSLMQFILFDLFLLVRFGNIYAVHIMHPIMMMLAVSSKSPMFGS